VWIPRRRQPLDAELAEVEVAVVGRHAAGVCSSGGVDVRASTIGRATQQKSTSRSTFLLLRSSRRQGAPPGRPTAAHAPTPGAAKPRCDRPEERGDGREGKGAARAPLEAASGAGERWTSRHVGGRRRLPQRRRGQGPPRRGRGRVAVARGLRPERRSRWNRQPNSLGEGRWGRPGSRPPEAGDGGWGGAGRAELLALAPAAAAGAREQRLGPARAEG
jgi:hypothetical protein